MKKMNILMVSDIIFEDEKAGSGRVVTEISKGLQKKGHQVTIITRGRPGLPEKEENEGRNIVRYPFFSGNLVKTIIAGLFQTRKMLDSLIYRESFDIVNYNHPQSSMIVNRIKSISAIPKVYTFFSPWHKEYEVRAKSKGKNGIYSKTNSLIRKKIERRMIKACEKVIALSNYSIEQLKEYHNIGKAETVLIPGGIDTERFKPGQDKKLQRKMLGLPEDKKILFTVRNLEPRMGLDNLIEALKIVTKKRNNVLLIIGGAGSLEKKLKQMASEFSLEQNVKFIGLVNDEQLPLYYQAADYFILPTAELEGFGLVTLEALSCGTPVLATDVGATRELITGSEYLFKSPQPRDLAIKILEYLDISEERSKQISNESRTHVLNNYSWDKAADSYEKVLYEVIGKQEK
ncbi:MAG: glycosyltransferase family 4 protein [Elusimicrobia bacterium]|nr:glycosyltransferase family 4 protein [Elusimicrobiota bacterium]MBU2614481.1 glycosyltransferase family 4 protein [Elusimicrobiota bacterium]